MTKDNILAALTIVDLTEQELDAVVGGTATEAEVEGFKLPSAGWVCTLSGECSLGGGNCNPF